MAKEPPVGSGKSRRRRAIYLAVFAIVGILALAIVVAAARRYPGNRVEFLVFVLAYVLLAVLVLPAPRLYVYTFLAAFLFLGFCAKAVAYLALGILLVEPTGGFNGTGRAWDAALMPAIVGCVAVVVIRVAHLMILRGRSRPVPLAATAPTWYVRWRGRIIIASVVGIAALNLVNLVGAFYQIGVSPKVILPAHLNVPISWLFVAGLSMWAATIVGWEAQLASNRLGRTLMIPMAEAIASISTLSRAAYLFRALPYVVVVAEFPRFFSSRLDRRWRSILLLAVMAGFVATLASVSLLRLVAYPQSSQVTAEGVPIVVPANPAATSGAAPLQIAAADPRLKFVGREISLLIVGRWIGIEGVMSVSSYRNLSPDLLSRGLRENPNAGESAIYQHISGSSYQTTGQYVFLTTPGAIGVFFYSGSLVIVFIGMALITAVLLTFEVIASRLLANAFTVSIVAMSLANAVAQFNFPYLFVVLVIEQAIAVAALSFVGGGLVRGSARPMLWRREMATPSRVPTPIEDR